MLKVFFAKNDLLKESGMNSTLIAFLFSLGAVTLAEMGDKTQLLAMAFATRYKAHKVLWGVFIATVLNHGMAVAVGNLITRTQGLEVWIQAVASLSFIFFGLWTIRGDRLEGEEARKTRFGAVTTVAIAFFIAELGDKTQLATIALATKFPQNPFGILMGTTSGMLVADTIGIVFGVLMCKNIPERKIKLISAAAFILFGFLGCYQVASESMGWSALAIAAALCVLIVLTGLGAFYLMRNNQQIQESNPMVAQYCEVKKHSSPMDVYKL